MSERGWVLWLPGQRWTPAIQLVVVKSPQGVQEIRPPTPRATQPLHPIPSPAPRPPCPRRPLHYLGECTRPFTHLSQKRKSHFQYQEAPATCTLALPTTPSKDTGLGVGERKSLSLSGDPSKGILSYILQTSTGTQCGDPAHPETPEARITQKAGSVQEGSGCPRFSISLPMTLYLALTREKEEKEKVGVAVPRGALSSGASLGETAFQFKLSQAQKPEAQPSEKQELGGARSQRRAGGWAGSHPMLCWISCLMPPGASGPSQARQQAI